jgi:hypothetical protein
LSRFLILKFEKSIYITKISVYETFNPGTISKIFVKDQNNDFILIYDKSGNQTEVLENSRIFEPPLKMTSFKSNTIKILFEKIEKLIEIDAIKIQGMIEKQHTDQYSKHSEFIDTIEQQQHVSHVPYANTILSPIDFSSKNNIFIYNEIESQRYHVSPFSCKIRLQKNYWEFQLIQMNMERFISPQNTLMMK